MVAEALRLATRISRDEGVSVGVVNARFAKPLDRVLLLEQAANVPLLVTLEDNVVTGGFGSAVLETVQEAGAPCAIERIGWPDKFVEHGTSVDGLRTAYGLGSEDLYRRVVEAWGRVSAKPAEIVAVEEPQPVYPSALPDAR